MPRCDTEAMSLHLAEIATQIAPGAHAALLVDQAGWHLARRLVVPPNITLIPLPAKCPEPNPQENVWQFMRDNWLSNRVFKSFNDIVDLSLVGCAPGADQKARHDRLLMHVQTTAPLNDRLHHRFLPSEGDRDAAGTFETLPCVLPVPEGDKEWYLYAARAGLLIGVASHRRVVSLNTIARREAPTNRPAPPPFSSIMARRRRWLAA